MIQVRCACGWTWSRPESAPKTTRTCDHCQRTLTLACAESLPPGAGDGDFDAYLEVVAGPHRVGERLFLGGVADLPIGRSDGMPVHLPGAKVSRRHAHLSRVDFGPSRWAIADDDSAQGLFLNDRRITFRELSDGDVVRVGEYELRYAHSTAVAPRHTVATDPSGEPVRCPSCDRDLPAAARACLPCGIRLPSGRPLLVLTDDKRQAIREGVAAPWLAPLTWIVWFAPLPLPVLSDATGRRQPWAIHLIAALTIIASVTFLLTSLSSHRVLDVPGKELMLWPPGSTAESFRVKLSNAEAKKLLTKMNRDERAQFEATRQRLRGTVPDDQLDRRALEDLASAYFAARGERPGEFHAYQLVTYALLHDASSPWACATHLGGNLVFLFVFGTRINAVIGNLATLILYPLLAAAAGLAHLHFTHGQTPLLGASGAINGLAGMYLVLFPAHRVYCAMWVRFRIWCALRVFAIRGFWVLLLYFAVDAATVALQARSGEVAHGGVAHFAHLGGFATGFVLAFAILLSRTVDCGGGDLLSVILGRWAWPLVGRPSRWQRSPAA
jgi:membrane associated rhomboid family serine protease/pSer/pThr/pTyr-binding forkhead associated (FHA) protein